MRRLSLLVTSLAASATLACAPTATPEPRAPEAATVTDAPDTTSEAHEGEASAASDAAPEAEPEEPIERAAIPAPDDVAAPPESAEKTASGLASVVLTPGTGTEHPTEQSRVVVKYTGWTKDGAMFDSSELYDVPAIFTVNQIIDGWTEGLQLMTKGEKRRFWIPAQLAYGESPTPGGAPAGQLTFDIELVDIYFPPQVPEDVARPPAKAKKTKSGLVSRVLQPGTGTQHPGPTSKVTVHYSGWTTDGKMFDSSVLRGSPATFPLDAVIPGWSEGLQLMVVGEKRRLWIPENLAYEGRAGAPAGTLVFDVELLAIE